MGKLAVKDGCPYRAGMSEPRTWKTLASRRIYENRWIGVTESDVIAPTGAPALYGVVHFKNRAIGVLPIDEDGSTLLVGQARYTTGGYSWELPEGGGPLDQDPLDCAKRELSEEAGLRAERWAILLEDVHMSNSVTDESAYAYLAWDLSPDSTYKKDETEDLALRRVTFGEALRMAVAGEISDAFTLVMLFKADHLARTGGLPEGLAQLMLKD